MSNLSKMLKLYLAVNNIEQKQLAVEFEMSESSLTRLLQGKDVEMKSFANIIKWLSKDTKG